MSFFNPNLPSEFSAADAARLAQRASVLLGCNEAKAQVAALVYRHGAATPANGEVAESIEALLDHIDNELAQHAENAEAGLVEPLPDGYLDGLNEGLVPLRAIREFGTELTLGEVAQMTAGSQQRMATIS